MKQLRKNRVNALFIACLFVIAGSAVVFARTDVRRIFVARPEVKILLNASVNRGQMDVPVEQAEAISSGEIVNWKILSENAGHGAARDYKTIGQIPKGTVFVAGSATSDAPARVTYSIDNGKTYAASPTVSEKQPDGTMKQVAAPVSMYTQVRYEWTDPLASGGKLAASYQVRVK
jgi:uncharacterized repeat protein (TIGR01451 family)